MGIGLEYQKKHCDFKGFGNEPQRSKDAGMRNQIPQQTGPISTPLLRSTSAKLYQCHTILVAMIQSESIWIGQNTGKETEVPASSADSHFRCRKNTSRKKFTRLGRFQSFSMPDFTIAASQSGLFRLPDHFCFCHLVLQRFEILPEQTTEERQEDGNQRKQ